MDDRRMPQPKSPFAEALKHSPKENLEGSRRLYDSPDRREVTEANRKPTDKTEGTGDDPVVSTIVRKPI